MYSTSPPYLCEQSCALTDANGLGSPAIDLATERAQSQRTTSPDSSVQGGIVGGNAISLRCVLQEAAFCGSDPPAGCQPAAQARFASGGGANPRLVPVAQELRCLAPAGAVRTHGPVHGLGDLHPGRMRRPSASPAHNTSTTDVREISRESRCAFRHSHLSRATFGNPPDICAVGTDAAANAVGQHRKPDRFGC